MDRFADGAERLREILHPMALRNIAGLEMDFRDAQVVADDEAEQNFGEEASLLAARGGP